ncbi:YwqG family protein [Streptomyces sp. NPDC005820]|uniref:YwqG family protein n=1 Tax=Streptomyces sp. NPDC005820 TaxID=3157069 RepID=UPI0033DD3F13
MTDERYSRPAAQLLPEEAARRWTALLRPCLRLRRATEGERTVAVLGGTPDLPAGTGWPESPDAGPLSFVASVRCGTPVFAGLPPTGTLLFFYADDPEAVAAARVLYIPEGTPVSPAPPPPGLEVSPPVELTAEAEESAPDLWLPGSREALLGDADRPWPHPRETPAELRLFLRAFARLRTRIGHQLGGHPVPVQGPVEYEVADGDQDTGRWLLLAQFDSDTDAGTSWADGGTLYWLIRPEDLTAHRFDRARFTVQC